MISGCLSFTGEREGTFAQSMPLLLLYCTLPVSLHYIRLPYLSLSLFYPSTHKHCQILTLTTAQLPHPHPQASVISSYWMRTACPRYSFSLLFFFPFFFFQFSFQCGPCAVFVSYCQKVAQEEGWMGYNMINRLQNGRALERGREKKRKRKRKRGS